MTNIILIKKLAHSVWDENLKLSLSRWMISLLYKNKIRISKLENFTFFCMRNLCAWNMKMTKINNNVVIGDLGSNT